VTHRADVGLADLARALQTLQPQDEEGVAVIASCLGFELPRARAPSPPKPPLPPDTERPEDPAEAADEVTEDAPGPGDGDADYQLSLPRLTPIGRDTSGLTIPWGAADALEEFDPSRHLSSTLRRSPLFDPRWSRELVRALLVTDIADGPLDEDEAVERVAQAQPLDPIPRGVSRSLRRGAQVLVDHGEGMEPFADDAWELTERIERLAGSGNVTTLSCWDAPLRGVGLDLSPYTPPYPGAPVLAISDVGIGGPPLRLERARAREWLALAALLAGRGSPLVVFVPYRRERWPRVLTRQMTLVEWDRTTTAARAHAVSKRTPARAPR
jgi:hypothetical protein